MNTNGKSSNIRYDLIDSEYAVIISWQNAFFLGNCVLNWPASSLSLPYLGRRVMGERCWGTDFKHCNRVTWYRPKGSTCLPVLPEQHIPIVPDMMKIWSWVMRVINFNYWVEPYHVTQKSQEYAVLSLRLSPYPPLNWQPTNANSKPMHLWPPLWEGLHFANGSRHLHHSLVGHRPSTKPPLKSLVCAPPCVDL